MEVIVRAQIKKTEGTEKVKSAILNIFPDLEINTENDEIVGKTKSVSKLKELLKLQKIRASARSVLLSAKKGSKSEFKLSKQVAYIGKVNFISDKRPPLGSIEVTIESEKIDEVIDELTKMNQ
jgi:predicted RNA binding protein with dsRBD fold (UPF0201 family)